MSEIKYSIDQLSIHSKGQLNIEGWVWLNNDYELKVNLDDKVYYDLEKQNVIRKDVIDALQIEQGSYGFENKIKIETASFKTLKIECYYKDKCVTLIEKNIEQLMKEVQYIKHNIDEVCIDKEKILIRGWAFAIGGELVKVAVANKPNIEIKKISRTDVQLAYSEMIEDACIGFEIEVKGKIFEDILIEYSIDDYKVIQTISPFRYKKKQIIVKVKRYSSLLKLINARNIKKTLLFIKENGFKGLKSKVVTKINEGKNTEINYNEWLEKHLPTKEELEIQKQHQFEYNPKISIVVPTYNTPKRFLIEMIDSVREQTYSNWELCIADGNSQEVETIELLKQYKEMDSRIKVDFLDENHGISGNTNECIKLARGEYIGLFDHDDLLTPHALYEVVSILNKDKEAEFIYSDEDKTDETSTTFFEPHFKPDWAPDTLRSYNYICHFSVFSKKLLDQVGLFRPEYDGSQDHDMILRLTEQAKGIVHIPKILYHWRVHKNSTAGGIGVKRYAIDAGKKAIASHLERLGLKGEVSDGLFVGSYKVTYEVKNNPKVSIIIPNKDHKEDLEKCINSIINESSYRNYEIIIIENNSITEEIFTYYKELEKLDFIKVVTWKDDFNYSAINNYGVKFATGEMLLLLNNDIEIITPNWMEEMISYAQRDEVGIVGAKLYYPDNTIQHAGVIIGMLGVGGHVNKGKHRLDPCYFGRAQVVQNLSAVTAACLMIRKDVFEQVGGLEEGYKVAFNDIDLCMKVRDKEYLIVFTPHVELYHYESKSRGSEDTPEKVERFNSEIARFEQAWGLYRNDPYYNINLSKESEDIKIGK